ncbi:hypothetical protein [Promicromonospora sp. NPDC023805]|uniref:hypothetical protein n=1 Tax=Promicromonospora sp. NPDC023805 TaxID=3154696 RepID=UPI0033ED21A0
MDLAYLVVTRALKEVDQHLARFAADIARTAAPNDEISLLGDITIQAINGHIELARRRTIEEIHGRIHGESAPTKPPERTQEIIEWRGLNGERRRKPRTGNG